ncbi:MAG TPA: hypothetical protein DCY13_13510 [Verrucomicrobiales bacterium]|nr:hypothetical protein [Verrucomicrobiales bacterium]
MNLATAANFIRLRTGSNRGDGRFVGESASDGRAMLAREERSPREQSPVAATDRRTILLGVDFGARHTRIAAVFPGVEQFYLRRNIPTAVAFHSSSEEQTVSPHLYFGAEAVSRGERFRLVHPWQAGDLADPALAREFVRHLRELMRRSDLPSARAVVGVPATMSPEGRQQLMQSMRGLLEHVIFLPRPYLSALGLRDLVGAEKLHSPEGRPVLLADLGAGTTEVCRVGSRFPAPAEMRGVAFGGNDVELLIEECLRQRCPALRPSRMMIRGWFESFGTVGEPASPIVVRMPVDGTEQAIDITEAIRRGSEFWAVHVQQLVQDQLKGAEAGLPAQVFLCGGGSRLVNLGRVLGETFARAGHAGMEFTVVEEKELSLAARGALCAARQVRDDQWARFETA